MTSDRVDRVRSMTGQGDASAESQLGTLRVEIRTVNNRGLKCNLRLSDTLSKLERKIDALVRSRISRGSVSVSMSVVLPVDQRLPSINVQAATRYAEQLAEVRSRLGQSCETTVDLASLIDLPGVLVADSRESDRGDAGDLLAWWDLVRPTTDQAITNLNQMRQSEGQNMAASLRTDASSIDQHLEAIRALAPSVSEQYRNRLETKIQRLLDQRGIELQPIDLLREVQIYADRVDISEEITRLQSHLQMFGEVLAGPSDMDPPEPVGRKLDFVIQEMFRETNTIGSKASDSAISTHVVEIKCAMERMRELVQNLE